MRAEPGGIEQRGRLGDPAAVAQRLEVADVCTCVPLRACVGHQVVDAEVAQPLRLRARRRSSVKPARLAVCTRYSSGTSAVMS